MQIEGALPETGTARFLSAGGHARRFMNHLKKI